MVKGVASAKSTATLLSLICAMARSRLLKKQHPRL